MLNPISDASSHSLRKELASRASALAPCLGYNQTGLSAVRILRTEAVLHDIPVLYKPGAVFVLQGSKHGVLEGRVYRYDEEHYLAVSIPVPFRMTSTASPERPLLAVYVDFDMQMAAAIALEIEKLGKLPAQSPRGLVSSRIGPDIEDVLLRLLTALANPLDQAILGPALMRELHYRVLIGPQGAAMIAALTQNGPGGKVVRSLAWLRAHYANQIAVADLAKDAGMSVPSYHLHFKDLTGSSPMQYVKALRLHEARLMIARQNRTIAEVALAVGYASPAQFSRDFKRHFGRTATEETHWVREHLGEVI